MFIFLEALHSLNRSTMALVLRTLRVSDIFKIFNSALVVCSVGTPNEVCKVSEKYSVCVLWCFM